MRESSSVGYLLKQAQALLHARMTEALAPFDLTVSQYSCLFRLSVEPGISAADLARATFVTRQSMTTMLEGLLERGLVERATRAETGRALPVALTAKGTKELARARDVVDELESLLQADLGQPEADALAEGLAATVASLSR